MARKGSTKVKTGCLTCKTRRVKCDEERPYCRRCTKAGRRCEGYSPPPQGQAAYSWAELLAAQKPTMAVNRRTPSDIYSVDSMETRALEFFRLQVAPALSKHSRKNFWNIVVAQVGQQEPAVRHALSCISSLYEGLGDRSPSLLKPSQERFAITQYNMALGHLTSPKVDQNIVLLVCLLFICIETMRNNKDMAIQHCRHGVNICNNISTELSGWAREELQPIFLRLATIPHFFGMEATEFPEPTGLFRSPPGPDPESDQEKMLWDCLVNRTVRLVRQGLSHGRQGPLRRSPIPQSLFEEQQHVLSCLRTWRRHYETQSLDSAVAGDEIESRLHHRMECIVGQIWAACCLASSETCYDRHGKEFEALVRLSQRLVDLRASSGPMPKFILEMGFMPYLYFAVMHCRRLDLRVRALQHILLLAHDRENLFDARLLYSVGVRVVQIEHGIQLDPLWPECPGASAAPMAPRSLRIKSADVTEDVEVRQDATGHSSEYRKVYFVFQPDAIAPGYMEWVKIISHPRVVGAAPRAPPDQASSSGDSHGTTP